MSTDPPRAAELPSSGRLGLSLIHSHTEPSADLIFVHGLGGDSWRTWSWQREPKNFWLLWLSRDEELLRTRIFTFGYNAAFMGKDTSLEISDFVRELLLQMRSYSGALSDANKPIGTVRKSLQCGLADTNLHVINFFL